MNGRPLKLRAKPRFYSCEVEDTVPKRAFPMAFRSLAGASPLRVAPRRVIISALLPLLLLARPAAGNPWLLLALERQYPAWTDKGGAPPVGIIVVGGGLATYLAALREGKAPPGPGQRVVAGIALAKRFPDAKLVFTGGGEPSPIAAMARVGIDPARVIVEARSRNTAENAAFTSKLVKPKPSERWILVTSAYHMPRAIGSFPDGGLRGRGLSGRLFRGCAEARSAEMGRDGVEGGPRPLRLSSVRPDRDTATGSIAIDAAGGRALIHLTRSA